MTGCFLGIPGKDHGPIIRAKAAVATASQIATDPPQSIAKGHYGREKVSPSEKWKFFNSNKNQTKKKSDHKAAVKNKATFPKAESPGPVLGIISRCFI